MTHTPLTATNGTDLSVTLHLKDGTASGLIMAKSTDFSWQAGKASRTDLPKLIRVASKIGIYLLVGPDPVHPGRDRVYIGHSGNVASRLRSHDSAEEKDFFERAVFIFSESDTITKAHVQYLESCLITKIKDANRAELKIENKNKGLKSGGLPEHDENSMKRALNPIEILLMVLGFDVLRPAGEPVQTVPETNLSKPERIFKYVGISQQTIEARAKESGGEFILLKGSQVNQNEIPSCPRAIRRKRKDALELGDLKKISGDEKLWQTTRDLVFGSPSAAAGFVYGGPARGPENWKHEASGKTYAELRAAESSQV